MDLPLDARIAAARAAAPSPTREAAGRALVVVLHGGRAARLSRPRGVRVSVDAGRLWLTVAGRIDDVFLGPGDALEIDADGLLVVESDGAVPAVMRLERTRTARRRGAAGGAGRAVRSAGGNGAAHARNARPAGGAVGVASAAIAGAARRARSVAAAILRHALVRARHASRIRAERRVLLELDERTLRDIGASDALATRPRVGRDDLRRAIDRCTW